MKPNASSHGMFQRFFQWEAAGSVILLACAITALVWANSPWAATYFELEQTYIGVSWGAHAFKMSLGHWIGDGLMVVFFFVVGLEIKREVVVGELSSLRQAALPVMAAGGGMLVPAIVYASLNIGGGGAAGWGIPVATDIAFALGILSLFGKRAPIGLKVFLTALAIADDLGAVVVIALFYTSEISFLALGAAAGLLVVIRLAARARVRRIGIYLILMVGVWIAILASGVHATIAGVLLAMLVPVKSTIEPGDFLRLTRTRLEELEASGLTRESVFTNPDQVAALDDMYFAAEDARPTGLQLEHLLHPVQSFLILPLFALLKAGVPLGEAASFPSAISLGIIAGLILGKQVGILGACWLAIRCGWAKLPEGAGWLHMWGASWLAGIGFTMSIFISELAFNDAELIGEAKVGVLVASLVAAIGGFAILSRACKPQGDPARAFDP